MNTTKTTIKSKWNNAIICFLHPTCNCTIVCAHLLPKHRSDIHVNNTFLDILHNALVSFLLPPCKFHNDVTTRFHTPFGKTSKSELKNYHVRYLLQYDIQIFLLQNISYLISDFIETIRLGQLIMASPSTISRRNPVIVDLVF